MIVAIIWSVAGGIGVVLLAAGAMKWMSRDANSYDVQLAEVRRDEKLKLGRLENERARLDAEHKEKLLA